MWWRNVKIVKISQVDVIKWLFGVVAEQRHGLLVLATFICTFVVTWLYYDFAPGQTPLTARQLLGAAFIEFLVIVGCFWVWFGLARRGGRPRDEGRDGET